MTLLRIFVCLLMFCAMGATAANTDRTKTVLVLHGGAGVWRQELTANREQDGREAMRGALLAGHAILKNGGTSLDAVEASIRVLEDSPLFNAGKGAVLTSEGTAELDASIMEGQSRRAGAVAGVKRIRNPITAARMVMEKSPHVMMAGEGAEAFARAHGATMASPKYFVTPLRKLQLERIKAEEKKMMKTAALERDEDVIGTVGAVALDQKGNLAAGTSTGGMANKKFGRIGDSPVIGAGTYANNATCAVSCTGHGEYFIRSAVAHDVSALMEYKGLPLKAAADEALRRVGELGGKGGFIAIDRTGAVAMPFNTEGMFRGIIRDTGEIEIQVYR